MVRGLFDNPVMLLILLLIIILLFGAPKLPGMARSLGQSMRIFKSEVDGMKKDGNSTKVASAKDPVEGEVVNNNNHGSVAAPDSTDKL
ncbi:hypothetical protein HF984_01615 [Rothia terrae]|jgi:sec-independent protein translocase protein TatA|uniref:Sec-independent protein translocase protein TatA n=1 Tax=Rothia terrae TaxID=396015 RepID=A0A7H2BB55_9MICC|nr:twin-arginine translocase TatA/TatE family subunit [Rothia terrae]MDT0188782.1 twin-arginine translocase TatA/TatE family subunit [Rothia terrae]NKZ33485.1 hypothetical protein [Rothia terrae]QNV36901.1 twin-arginine translocase TatA/TatE family subunit [Rothia terrae]